MTGDATAISIAWSVAYVVVVVMVSGLSRKIGWSAPLLLVGVGIIAAFIPAVPEVRLEPEAVLIGVLPPLLFASALRTPFLEIRARGDSVLSMSVGLVVFSTVVVGLVTVWLVPDLDGGRTPAVALATGLAFGAIVAPTDAVSVSAVAGGLLPRRLGTLLESEGLLNDATALVALNTAIMAIVEPIGIGQVLGDFAIAVAGGVASGVLVAFVLTVIRQRLKAPVLDTSLSLISPYLAFLPAYAVRGSGFLAVAITGLWLGYRAPLVQSAEARIAERINWRTLSFLLENAVFLLIGLQLPRIVQLSAKTHISLPQGIGIGVGIYLAMTLARFVWGFAITALYRYGPQRLRDRRWSWRVAVAISAAGMRGVVTLAAAFLLPEDTTPQVGFLQLMAFVIVVASLLQGLTLGPLIRRLRLPLPNPEQDRLQIRSLIGEAQASAIERLDAERDETDPEDLVRSLRQSAEYRVSVGSSEEAGMAGSSDSYARLRLLMLDSERRSVLQARVEGRYEESAIAAVLADFDAIEIAMKRSRRRDLPPVQRRSRRERQRSG